MNIQQAVKQAIEEFGKFAHERFRCKVDNGDWHTPLRNEMLLMWLNDNKIVIELKALPELFDHGVKFYGFEQEIQMWEFKGAGGDWQDIPDHADYRGVLRGMSKGFYQQRRKNSAALPFDLPRAIAGDVVEFKNCYENDYTGSTSHEWVALSVCKPLPDGTITGAFYVDNHLFNVEVDADEIGEFLRHKYPKAAI